MVFHGPPKQREQMHSSTGQQICGSRERVLLTLGALSCVKQCLAHTALCKSSPHSIFEKNESRNIISNCYWPIVQSKNVNKWLSTGMTMGLTKGHHMDLTEAGCLRFPPGSMSYGVSPSLPTSPRAACAWASAPRGCACVLTWLWDSWNFVVFP